MPELPDITVYVEGLQTRVVGERVRRIQVTSPFLVRTVDPPLNDAIDREVVRVFRIGKRVVLELQQALYLVIHLMIAGRFKWAEGAGRTPPKIGLASFAFCGGTLHITEAGAKKRASLHVVQGADAVRKFDRGGLDILRSDQPSFAAAIRSENHTLKRALTDPRIIDGVGNAYSDEILHAARLSPLRWTSRLDDDEVNRLFDASCDTLSYWIDTLRQKFANRFPGPRDITAFRKGFAVHGRFNQPCPVCTTKVQRIRYANRETNYCPRCQTAGKILADRSLSRLLKDDWPRSIDELESD